MTYFMDLAAMIKLWLAWAMIRSTEMMVTMYCQEALELTLSTDIPGLTILLSITRHPVCLLILMQASAMEAMPKAMSITASSTYPARPTMTASSLTCTISRWGLQAWMATTPFMATVATTPYWEGPATTDWSAARVLTSSQAALE